MKRKVEKKVRKWMEKFHFQKIGRNVEAFEGVVRISIEVTGNIISGAIRGDSDKHPIVKLPVEEEFQEITKKNLKKFRKNWIKSDNNITTMRIWGKTGNLDPTEHGIRSVLRHLQKNFRLQKFVPNHKFSQILFPENCNFTTG